MCRTSCNGGKVPSVVSGSIRCYYYYNHYYFSISDHQDVGIPDFGFPDFGFPDFGFPDFGFPDFDFPDFGFPDFDFLDFDLSHFYVPGFRCDTRGNTKKSLGRHKGIVGEA